MTKLTIIFHIRNIFHHLQLAFGIYIRDNFVLDSDKIVLAAIHYKYGTFSNKRLKGSL